MDTQTPPKNTIRNIYLYLVSFVALMMLVFSTADIVNIILRTYVFTKADQYEFYGPTAPCPAIKSPDGKVASDTPDCAAIDQQNRKSAADSQAAQRQRDIVRDISMILVGIPLFAFHWRIIKRKE